MGRGGGSDLWDSDLIQDLAAHWGLKPMPDADFVLECLSMSAFLKTGKSQSIAYHWCRCWLRGSGFWQQSKFFGCTN